MSATEDRVAQAVRDIFEFGATQRSQFALADIRRHQSRRWTHRAERHRARRLGYPRRLGAGC
jgi:hypothetical protein